MPCPVGTENSLIPKDLEGQNAVTPDPIRGCLGFEHPSERRYYARTHGALGNLPLNLRQRELYLGMDLMEGDLFLRFGRQIVVEDPEMGFISVTKELTALPCGFNLDDPNADRRMLRPFR